MRLLQYSDELSRRGPAQQRDLAGSAVGAGLAAGALPAGGDVLDLPLLQPTDISYVGSYSLPDFFMYGLGYGGPGALLIATGDTGSYQLRRYAIPSIGGSLGSATAGPITLNGAGFNSETDRRLHGTLQVGDRILYGMAGNYNGNGGSQSAFVASINTGLSSTTTPQAPASVIANSGQRGMVGMFGQIPEAYRSLFDGADVFAGTNVKSIINNDSIGPGFVAFNSADVDGSGTVPNQNLLAFAHGDYSGGTPYWFTHCGGQAGAGEATNFAGAAIIPGTRTLLYFGHQGTGTLAYHANAALDPCNPYQGQHAYPYEAQAWAFDLRDIVAVKNGTLQPHQPRPYGTRAGANGWNFFGWQLSGPPGACFRTMYQSGFFDPDTNRIHMKGHDDDTVHVWQVG